MNTHITLAELLLIFIVCLPVYALGKTIIDTIENKNNNQ